MCVCVCVCGLVIFGGHIMLVIHMVAATAYVQHCQTNQLRVVFI